MKSVKEKFKRMYGYELYFVWGYESFGDIRFAINDGSQKTSPFLTNLKEFIDKLNWIEQIYFQKQMTEHAIKLYRKKYFNEQYL